MISIYSKMISVLGPNEGYAINTVGSRFHFNSIIATESLELINYC